MREEILEEGHGSSFECSRSGSGSMTTDSRAIRLMTSPILKEYERRVEAITYMLNQLQNQDDTTKIKFLQMKYFDNQYTDLGICQRLNISRATFFRFKDQIIQLVAERLGFEV